MSCVKPLKAYWANVVRDRITFDPVHSATKVPFALPCGRCIGCRMEKARQWGLRCVHEARLWPVNSYVTLTYDDEHLPPGGSVSLRDVQLFMKRLRKAREPSKVRFFLGAEYGDENRRPHYHALFFNCGFKDAVVHGVNKRGESLYTSRELESIWGLGYCTIGAVTFDSAVYTAKYALKSVSITEHSTPEARAEYEKRYVVYDADGLVYERDREFAVMSRRPGIGAGYFARFGQEVLDHDNVILDGREVRPPRFYDLRSERLGPDKFAANKRKRKRLSVLNRLDNTAERLRVKEKLMEIAAKKKERTL